jgi:hypothetical protein
VPEGGITKLDSPNPSREATSRRTIMKASVALLAAGILSPMSSALAQTALRRTQDQILGPFYPIMSKPARSGDLTRVPGGSGRAKGQLLIVRGRVIDPTGSAVAGVRYRNLASQFPWALCPSGRHEAGTARSQFRGIRRSHDWPRWPLPVQNHKTASLPRCTGHDPACPYPFRCKR